MIATPEKSLSPLKKDLVERAWSRRREITPFPTEAPNKIIARVLTKETEHPSLGRVTRASEKRRAADAVQPKRVSTVYTYDELQENSFKEENDEEWLDREEFCKRYELE